MSEIQKKAMLTELNISCWTARKFDRDVSNQIDRQNNAVNAGRYNKRLIPPAAMANINSIVGYARTIHLDYTLPWSDKGPRLLPSNMYFSYIQAISEAKNKFETAVNDFINIYPSLILDAQSRLGSLFNSLDYPTPDALKSKFCFKTVIMPIPDSQDFRVSVGDIEQARIKEDIKRQIKEAEQTAINALWTRVHDVLDSFLERLTKPDTLSRSTIVEQCKELVSILPKLNFNDDPQLTDTYNELKNRLCIYSTKELSQSKSKRLATTRSVLHIQSKMKHFMEAS